MLTHTKLKDSGALWLLVQESNLLLGWKLLTLFVVDKSSILTVKADNTKLGMIKILLPDKSDEGHNR